MGAMSGHRAEDPAVAELVNMLREAKKLRLEALDRFESFVCPCWKSMQIVS